jgi:hypothetical protein
MSGLQQASNESCDATLLILKRIETIDFGPIRCIDPGMGRAVLMSLRP